MRAKSTPCSSCQLNELALFFVSVLHIEQLSCASGAVHLILVATTPTLNLSNSAEFENLVSPKRSEAFHLVHHVFVW